MREKEGDKFIRVVVDCEREDAVEDESLSKERLASKPVRLITKCGRHLSISSNPETA